MASWVDRWKDKTARQRRYQRPQLNREKLTPKIEALAGDVEGEQEEGGAALVEQLLERGPVQGEGVDIGDGAGRADRGDFAEELDLAE